MSYKYIIPGPKGIRGIQGVRGIIPVRIIKKYLFFAILCAIFLFLMIKVIDYGIKKNEALECQKWLRREKEYLDYYSMDYEKEQCLNYGIELK